MLPIPNPVQLGPTSFPPLDATVALPSRELRQQPSSASQAKRSSLSTVPTRCSWQFRYLETSISETKPYSSPWPAFHLSNLQHRPITTLQPALAQLNMTFEDSKTQLTQTDPTSSCGSSNNKLNSNSTAPSIDRTVCRPQVTKKSPTCTYSRRNPHLVDRHLPTRCKDHPATFASGWTETCIQRQENCRQKVRTVDRVLFPALRFPGWPTAYSPCNQTHCSQSDHLPRPVLTPKIQPLEFQKMQSERQFT
ncbi:uncharacterized protein BDV17DRAFT_242812 [Aspergillus undulatus]|uniref:uncharacterized protein n=1 Tax=Aspergillus undulatus TaxID=1810928 RepID=UPI003CCDEC5E